MIAYRFTSADWAVRIGLVSSPQWCATAMAMSCLLSRSGPPCRHTADSQATLHLSDSSQVEGGGGLAQKSCISLTHGVGHSHMNAPALATQQSGPVQQKALVTV